jgi:hypothetical protein
MEGLKFVECLPEALAVRVLERRLSDAIGVGRLLGEPCRAIGDTVHSQDRKASRR